MNGREKRVEVFKDTEKIIKEKYESAVKDSIDKSVVYIDSQPLPKKECTDSKYIVNKLRSFEAAENIAAVCKDKKIAVLNFASPVNPGGYVAGGSSAQEEALCRVSTLYNVISNEKFKKDFYEFNRSNYNPLSTNRLIYSPNIIIFKDDDFELLDKPYVFDVITCAAPNLRKTDINDEALFTVHYYRCCHIISAAAANNVDILVLGAFGCGVFQNNPTVVAKAMKKALDDSPYKFFRVIFPVYCRDDEIGNYNSFMEVFK